MKPDTFLNWITPNFSYQEMTKSLTAKRKGIDNTPSVASYINLTKLCKFILQPIRDKWGAAIIVSSGYRCPQVNKLVGGVSNCIPDISAGVTLVRMGRAASELDVQSPQYEALPMKSRLLYELIRRMYKAGELPDLKQCIDEYDYDWIHIAYQDGRTPKLGQFIHIQTPSNSPMKGENINS